LPGLKLVDERTGRTIIAEAQPAIGDIEVQLFDLFLAHSSADQPQRVADFAGCPARGSE
jgi:hypothetical protein